MNKKIGEQFAMMNEISAQISDKTFDKFVEEAVAEDLNKTMTLTR